MLRLVLGVGVCLALAPTACAEASDVNFDSSFDLEAGTDDLADSWFEDEEGELKREGVVLASAKDIPKKPRKTVKLRSGTYDFGGRTIDGSGVGKGAPLFSCNKQSGVTFKNVKIVGKPRYGLFVRGCNNMKISDVKMYGIHVGGIRFDKGHGSKNLQIGSVKIENVGGHAVELWDVQKFSISKVESKKTKGCGLLLNRCRNGKVGSVYGDQNNKGGGYATMRFANKNGKVTVKKVKSKNSGRGVFSVSGSKDATVNSVDISGSTKEGIYIQDARNTKVKSGKVRGRPNCRIRGGGGNSIKADCGGKIAK